MFNTGPHTQLGTVQRVCNELGTAPPPGFTAALDRGDKLRAALDDMSSGGDVGKLHDAVFDALLAGRNPAADKAVHTLLVTAQLEDLGLHRRAADRIQQITGAAIVEHSDDFAAAWHRATDGDGAILRRTAALPRFADAPDLNTMTPAQLADPDDHQSWVAAATAARRLDAAADGLRALLAANGIAIPADRHALVLAPGLGLTALTAINRTGHRVTAWTLARHGVTPTACPSIAAVIEANGAIAAEQAQQAAEAADITDSAGFDGPTPEQRRRYAELTGQTL